MSEHRTVNFYMVAAGDYHDIDFARLELLKLLAEDEKIRVQVAADYHDIEAIQAADVLVTYTCNLVPTEAEQVVLRDFVASGKRWFALHGTNAILQFLADGRVDCPETAPVLMETLGSQFLGHPPIQPFTVHVSDPVMKFICVAYTATSTIYCTRALPGTPPDLSTTNGKRTYPIRSITSTRLATVKYFTSTSAIAGVTTTCNLWWIFTPT